MAASFGGGPNGGMVHADSDSSWMVEVWADSLSQEFRRLREAVVDYPYVAMDTEFPGVVARPLSTFKTASDYHYQCIKCNCDLCVFSPVVSVVPPTFVSPPSNPPSFATTTAST